MRVIIAGGRDFTDFAQLCERCDFYLKEQPKDSVIIISGRARGADALGEKYAQLRGYGVQYFPADWNKLGKRAGIVRNEQMGQIADVLIAFWDKKSRGTSHMINFMKDQNKPVRVVNY